MWHDSRLFLIHAVISYSFCTVKHCTGSKKWNVSYIKSCHVMKYFCFITIIKLLCGSLLQIKISRNKWQCSLHAVSGMLQYKQWSIFKSSMYSWNQWSDWNGQTRRRSISARETAEQRRINSRPSAAAQTVSTREATVSAHRSWRSAGHNWLLGVYGFLYKTRFFNFFLICLEQCFLYLDLVYIL